MSLLMYVFTQYIHHAKIPAQDQFLNAQNLDLIFLLLGQLRYQD